MFRNGLQPAHIILLLVVVLLVFGASRLPDIARSLGKSAKVLKEEIKDLRDDPADSPTTTPPVAPSTPVPPVTPPPVAGIHDQATPGTPAQPGSGAPTEWPPGSSSH